jgi:hypothetical protein
LKQEHIKLKNMKKLTHGLLAFTIMFAMASCGDNPEVSNASSTPVDSTNLTGAAPVEYGADNPAVPDSPKTQGAHEEGIRANNASSEDSMKGRH